MMNSPILPTKSTLIDKDVLTEHVVEPEVQGDDERHQQQQEEEHRVSDKDNASDRSDKDECNWSISTVPNVLNEDEEERPRRKRDARWRAERDVVQTLDFGITTPFTTFHHLLSLSHVSQVTVVALYFMWVRDPSTAAI